MQESLTSANSDTVRQGEKAIGIFCPSSEAWQAMGTRGSRGNCCSLRVQHLVTTFSSFLLLNSFIHHTYQIWTSTTPNLYCLLRNKGELPGVCWETAGLNFPISLLSWCTCMFLEHVFSFLSCGIVFFFLIYRSRYLNIYLLPGYFISVK